MPRYKTKSKLQKVIWSSAFDLQGLDKFVKDAWEALERQRSEFIEKPTYGVHGFGVAEDDTPAGQLYVRAVAANGRRLEGPLTFVDSQQVSDVYLPLDQQDVVSKESSPERSSHEVAQDSAVPLLARIEALNEWIFLDNNSAASFVLHEFEQRATSDEWLTALVFAAEDVKLPLAEQQDQAARLLRDVALNLRNRAEARFERVVWSAIRRFGSLVPVENADQLLDFLDRKGAVDTRLVALQSVVHIFELEPLADPATVQRLADRVFELAIKLLDRDLLFPGEIAAIVEQAIQALACMGDPRLRDCLDRLPSVEAPWFAELVNRNLRGLLEEWSKHVGEPAYQQLVDVLRGGE